MRTGGVGLAARPNLARATRVSSQRAAPGRVLRAWGRRARRASTLQGPASLSSRALGCELRARGNGGALGTARYPRRAARGWGPRVREDRRTCPASTLSVAACRALRRYGTCAPAVMADSGVASRPRRGPGACEGSALGKRCSCLASNFARILVTLPRLWRGRLHLLLLQPGRDGGVRAPAPRPGKVVPPARKRL